MQIGALADNRFQVDPGDLRAIAQEKGISYRQWAIRAGLSPNTIYNHNSAIRDGKAAGFNASTVQRLAEAAGVSVDRILGKPPVKNTVPLSAVPVISESQCEGVRAGTITSSEELIISARGMVAVPFESSTVAGIEIADRSVDRQIGRDGGIAVFDWQDRELEHRQFYLIKVGDNFVVRRYCQSPPRFEADSTEPFEPVYDLESVSVIGRVLSFSREPR